MKTEQLQKLISQGEGLTVEFKKAKEQLPNNLFETICAFLNRSGGEILLGVHDDKTVEGINKNRAEQLSKEIANLSNNPQKLFPSFLLEPRIVDFDGKKLIYIFVPVSSQVHKTAGKIFDRSADGDFVFKEEDVFITEVPLLALNKNKPNNVVDNVVDSVVDKKLSSVLELIKNMPDISANQIGQKLNVNSRTAQRYLDKLKKLNKIKRIGSNKGGYWQIIN